MSDCLICNNYKNCKNREGDKPLDFMKSNDRCVLFKAIYVNKKINLQAIVLGASKEPLSIVETVEQNKVPKEGYIVKIGDRQVWLPKEVVENA